MFNSKEIQYLQEENNRLRAAFYNLYGLKGNINNLDQEIQKLRLEGDRLNEESRELNESLNAIRIEEQNKRLEIEELSIRIEDLNEIKSGNLTDNIDSITWKNQDGLALMGIKSIEIEEIESLNSEIAVKKEELEQYINNAHQTNNKLREEETELAERKNSIAEEVSQLQIKLLELQTSYTEAAARVKEENDKIGTLKLDEERIREKLDKRQFQFSIDETKFQWSKKEEKTLSDKLCGLKEEESLLLKKIEDLKENESLLSDKIGDLKKDESLLSDNIWGLKENESLLLNKIGNLKEKENLLLSKIGELNEKEGLLTERIGALQSESISKIKQVREIDIVLSGKTKVKDSLDLEYSKLTDELNEKREILIQTQSEYNKFMEDIELRKKELLELKQAKQTQILEEKSLSAILCNLKEEENILLSKVGELNEKEGLLTERIGALQSEETSKIKEVREIDLVLSGKTKVKDSLDLEYSKLTDELKEKKETLIQTQSEYKKFVEDIELRKKELLELKQAKQTQILEEETGLQSLKEEENLLLSKIGELNEKEGLLTERIGALQSESISKIKQVREIDLVLSGKTEEKDLLDLEYSKLMDELKEKKETLIQTQSEYNKFMEDIELRKKELLELKQALIIKAQRLSNINIELMDHDKKYGSFNNEIDELKNFRDELLRRIQTEKETANKLVNQNKKLTELVQLLEKRKQEMEQGNIELEVRCTSMFQKLNQELNEINRRRSVVEQIILQREKEIDEKEQILSKKIASVEECERVLNLRLSEVGSLEKHIALLSEDKERYRNDLNKIEQETIEKKNYSSDIRIEIELLLKKKVTLEKNHQDLLQYMNESYASTRGRNSKFENEFSYYEDQIQGYRTKISDSIKELDELRKTVSLLKRKILV